MNQNEQLNIGFFAKVFLLMTLILSMVIPIDALTNTKTANAMPTAMMDGQNSCTTGDIGESSDSDSSSDSGSSKDSGDSSGGLTKEQKENIKKGYEYMHDKYGVSGAMMAGIFGNFMHESNINPKSVEGITGVPTKSQMKSAERNHADYHTGLGLGQWSYERNDMLVDHAEKMKKDWWEIEVQLDFMVTADSGAKIFKDLAKSSSDDIKKNTNEFHDEWEAGGNPAYINGKDPSMGKREKHAEEIWKYMKKEGMDGKKDESKISKISGKSDGKDSGSSSASSEGDKQTQDICDKDEGESSEGAVKGEIGKSTKINGGKGKKIAGNWKYEDIPEKYKKHVELPKLDTKYLENSPFDNGHDKGQCTEFTWAMMNQLYEGTQKPYEGVTNGKDVHAMYKRNGAKTTHHPTVGYGFSSSVPYMLASIPEYGHTGVIAGVMDDGKFIIAQMNVPPDPAPSRTVLYSVIDGVPKDAGNEMIFFNGMNGGKVKKKYKKN